MSLPAPPNAGPGWYPDPEGSGSYRYWDGGRWTDAVSSAIPPAATAASDTTTWALAAHLTALLALVIGLPFLGPLVIYFVKKDNPFVRRHAAEALNFNISVAIYFFVLGMATLLLLVVVVGILLVPVLIALAIFWIVYVVLGTIAASRGEEFRYPLTIRFVN